MADCRVKDQTLALGGGGRTKLMTQSIMEFFLPKVRGTTRGII